MTHTLLTNVRLGVLLAFYRSDMRKVELEERFAYRSEYPHEPSDPNPPRGLLYENDSDSDSQSLEQVSHPLALIFIFLLLFLSF